MSKQNTPAVDPFWRERPLHKVQDAAKIIGVSTASIYLLARKGDLELKRLAGRTVVTVESLAALIDSAEPWTPSGRATAANAARRGRAAAARRDFAK